MADTKSIEYKGYEIAYWHAIMDAGWKSIIKKNGKPYHNVVYWAYAEEDVIELAKSAIRRGDMLENPVVEWLRR